MSANYDIPNVYGALLLGGLLASVFSGVLALQCKVYSKTCESDTFRTKGIVVGLWVLDVIHTAFIWAALWIWFISRFGNVEGINDLPITIPLSILVTAITTTITHLVFLYRIYRLSKNNLWMTIPILVLAILRSVFACVTSGEIIHLQTLSRFRAEFQWLFSLGLALSSTIDILITTMMMVLLRQSRARSLSLHAVIDSLTLYTVENGAITSIATVLSMICWLTMKNLIFMGVYFVIAKLYANTVLAVLNSRQHLRRTHESTSRSNDGVMDLEAIRLSEARGGQRLAGFLSQSRSGSNPPRLESRSRTDDTAAEHETTLSKVEVNVKKTVQFHTDYDPSEVDDAESTADAVSEAIKLD